MATLAIEDVTFTYRGAQQPALSHVDLTIEPGRFVAVMGQSGCGKSTLCLTCNASIPHSVKGEFRGRVILGSNDLAYWSVAEASRMVGIVFQEFETQLFSTTVKLEVAFGLENYGLPTDEIRRRVDEYLGMMGLGHLRDRAPVTLSGGEKQRLVVASVLALEPEIVVMDEPTTDVDDLSRSEIYRVSREISRAGRAVVVTTHDADPALATDEVILMKGGVVVARGRSSAILGEVDLLVDCGVRPPQIAQLFAALGIRGVPLTVEAALRVLDKERFGVRRVPQTPEAVSPVIVELRSVSFSYGDGQAPALRGVDLKIREGEFVAILGSNGSGKTTLGKVMSGLLRPGVGDVLLAGVSIRGIERHVLASFVAYVFQNPDHQLFSATVSDEVSFGPRNFAIPERDIRDRVAGALEAVGLESFAGRDPLSLTKGARQRVAVASVLALDPRVLVLDEPTTGLDHQQQLGMMETLARLNRIGRTIVIITHSLWAAAEYSSRTVLLKGGSIALDGQTRDVFAREDVLAACSLTPPPIVQLSNRLGTDALSVGEMLAILGRD